jgi:tyrocidine synthetase-2
MTELIADIWRDVLGTRDVDDATDFFDAGGHSLTAVKIVSRIEADCDIDLPVHLLFDYPVLADFRKVVEELIESFEGAA